jgi:ubiquinone biosynthesis protein
VIAQIPSLGKTYRHVNRYRQLITILMKYGFQDIVEQLNLRYYVELGKSVLLQRPAEHSAQIPRAVRVRLILEEMGTTFIKFGQIMSTRPDLMPQEFIDELKKLQDAVPPFPTPEAIALIESELAAPVKDLFTHFDDTPIASASIAQVYRAVVPDGS